MSDGVSTTSAGLNRAVDGLSLAATEPTPASPTSTPSTPATPAGKYVPPQLRNRVSAPSLVPESPVQQPSRDFRDAFRRESNSRDGNGSANGDYPSPRGNGAYGGSSGGGGYGGSRRDSYGSGRDSRDFRVDSGRSFGGSRSRGSGLLDRVAEDWSIPLPRDERLERELFGAPNTGINFDKYEDIPVDVTGKDPVAPIVDFSAVELGEITRMNLELCRYTKPTPVQKHAMPIISSGRDLMACAQTGSGKTAAFLVPILNKINRDGPGPRPEPTGTRRKQYPLALILAPTRELAQQIYDEALKFSYRSHVRPCVVYGGADFRDQVRQLDRGCQLLVATPGRLVDMMERGHIGLDCVRFLVLDEADRMLDMGFEPQIRKIVEGEDSTMPPVGERQTVMFSATFPHQIQRLAGQFLHNHLYLTVGRVGAASDNITQRFEYLGDGDKRSCLLDLLDHSPLDSDNLTLVFVETKKGADMLEEFLYREKYPVASIHGDRSQYERESALAAFRNGRTPVLVATAVAARGLDIPNVRHVINYDLPTEIGEYVHRIGRTGRVGNVGTATSFYTDKNINILRDLVDLLVEAKQVIPPWMQSSERSSHRGGGGGVRSRGRDSNRDYRHSGTGGGYNRGGSGQGHDGGGSRYDSAPRRDNHGGGGGAGAGSNGYHSGGGSGGGSGGSGGGSSWW